MISVKGLSFKYEGSAKSSLNNINLEIEKGDFLGIIGESGSGKTTLTRAINALIPHHYKGDFYGSVNIDGTDSFDTTPGKLALKVGSVFQDIDSQLVSTFVEDEILFGLENFGFPKEEILKKVDEVLEEFGIQELRYREIASLSGGQKQKVAIAAIVALNPEILILDEPTGELDPASSRQIFALLEKLNREKNMTIIIVEQKIMLLCEFAKKIAVMEEGSITSYGPIREVLANAENLEKKGINIPRVVTLSREIFKDGKIALNSDEASLMIKEEYPSAGNGANSQGNCTASQKNCGSESAETASTSQEAGAENGTPSQKSAEPSALPSNSTPLLEFKNVTFSYKGDANLKNISAKVNKGDFVAIIGSNGAGKSTFSKLCNGLLKPSNGEVSLNGKNIKKTKTSLLAKQIGFLFQNPDRQICCNTVREEIQFSLKNIGLPKDEIENRTERTLSEFNFNPEQNPFNMSRGQRQRLCLACLIALESELLILDEPTTGLDYKECMELMGKIKALNEKGTTVIMVCHDMEVVLDFATKIFVMASGELLSIGDTKSVFSDETLLSRARLLPPQIAETAHKLNKNLTDIFTVQEMKEYLRGSK